MDTDIAVYWRQAANQPARVDLVPYKAEAGKRGTFALTLTPGMDLQPITEGRDWVFVLDRSGSMKAKIATLAEGITRAYRTAWQDYSNYNKDAAKPVDSCSRRKR